MKKRGIKIQILFFIIWKIIYSEVRSISHKFQILAKSYGMGKTIVKLHLHVPLTSFQYKKQVTPKTQRTTQKQRKSKKGILRYKFIFLFGSKNLV